MATAPTIRQYDTSNLAFTKWRCLDCRELYPAVQARRETTDGLFVCQACRLLYQPKIKLLYDRDKQIGEIPENLKHYLNQVN